MDFFVGLTWDIIKAVLVTAFVTLLFSCSIFAIIIRKIRVNISASLTGVQKIYRNCTENKKILKKTLTSAKELYFIAVIGDEFTKVYKDILRVAVQRELDCKILVAKHNSEYLKNLWNLRGLDDVEEANKRIQRLKKEWEQIVNQKIKGSIEIRFFDTEITNQIVICKKSNENYISWVTLAMPPKRAVDSILIEFADKESKNECMTYFMSIWNLHSKDILFKNIRDNGIK